MPEPEHLKLRNYTIGTWEVSTIGLPSADRCLSVFLSGTIVNSVTENHKALRDWKEQVMTCIKKRRGEEAWDPRRRFAITLFLKFCPKNHGGHRKLDVDNFAKPIIDAIAAGLFCGPDIDPSRIKDFNYDDSNFKTLLIHRLSDTVDPAQEGVAIHVSTT